MKSINNALVIAVSCSSSFHVALGYNYQRPSASQTTGSSTTQRVTSAWDERFPSGDIKPPRRLIPKLFRKENRWEAIELVRGLRGGGGGGVSHSCMDTIDRGKPTFDNSDHQPFDTPLDFSMRSVSLWLAVLVGWQAMATFLDHNENLLHEIADRLLSPESASAVKMIRKIIKQFEDLGVVDVFKVYPAKDIVIAILALGKLQSASAYYEAQRNTASPDVDRRVVEDLAHYSLYASASYGWTMEAAFGGRLHMGNLRTLFKKTGIDADDVITASWESKTHRPAYFIVRDRQHKTIVLAIRGTLSARDVLTDLCATAETYETGCEGVHRAHHGMLQAARRVAAETEACLDAELALNPDYSLVLVGHSLGGGVASVLGTLWESKYHNLAVYGYGSPCVGPIDARPTTCDYIISVLGEGDPFSSLSLGHIADVSKALALLCEDDELRSVIRRRTDGAVDQMSDDDLRWCASTMGKLRESLTGERMYPPGRTLFIKRAADNSVSLSDVAHSMFTDLRLHPRMLDVSRHVPSLYESLLQEIVETSLI